MINEEETSSLSIRSKSMSGREQSNSMISMDPVSAANISAER